MLYDRTNSGEVLWKQSFLGAVGPLTSGCYSDEKPGLRCRECVHMSPGRETGVSHALLENAVAYQGQHAT